MDQHIFENLNAEQQEAVKYTKGPSIILAGAGSGKTRVLIHKVAHLIVNEQVLARHILMITFTNKAAGEMKERIAHMMASRYGAHYRKELHSLGFVGTFHSFCAKLLRMHGEILGLRSDYVIYTDQEQESLMKQILKRIDAGKMTAGFFLNKISEAKNQLITPENYLDHYSFYKAAQVAQVYHAYSVELAKYHAVDFDDLIMKAVELLKAHPELLYDLQHEYSHIMIDEFQDTNYAQYALVRLLAVSDGNVTVVGDFSQAIYSWRGADIKNLERFTEHYPSARTFYLEQNYRSTQQILDYAYSKIILNQSHPILKLFTQESHTGAQVIEYEADNEEYESLYIAKTILELAGERIASGEVGGGDTDVYASFAVLYRTNAQSRIIEEIFLTYAIPYTLVGGTRFYERKEIRDVLAYLRLIVEPEDPVAVERIRKLGKRRWEKFVQELPMIQQYAHDADTESLLEMVLAKSNYLDFFNKEDPEDYARLENIKELKNVASQKQTLVDFFEQIALIENEYSYGEKTQRKGSGVRLMSLHASKGLEFDTVFIAGLEDGLLPHMRSIDDSYAIEEERRLFYVGITRAKSRLYITWARRRGLFGRNAYTTKSRFIETHKQSYDEDPSVVHPDDQDSWDW